MSPRITGEEAAEILRDLARGREDGNGGDVWPLYDRAEDAMAAVVALAADLAAERTRADAAEADRDYWRAQATMAAPCVDAVRALGSRLIPGGTGCAVDPERVVAAAEGLRREAALATMERDTLRGLSDALRADNARLRAIVAG